MGKNKCSETPNCCCRAKANACECQLNNLEKACRKTHKEVKQLRRRLQLLMSSIEEEILEHKQLKECNKKTCTSTPPPQNEEPPQT
mmetsp:Transcript_11588/g.16097  ORF Transcript_11588/g.16097 Transcript_11588/m.16097 type:complete len:86 (+) Transcript_11588:118-375(+)